MSKEDLREKRHKRVRKKITGTEERPRLCVYKSNRYIYAQIIDDMKGHTLASASSIEEALRSENVNCELSKKVGLLIGTRAVEHGIKTVVFDRSGYRYHGNIKSLADGAREGGLEF
uniref:Large ribosomal subunit protein uL18 n=1 Tax=uncultured Nitrospirae bacterium Rifle_16ft_4_minimus_18822 TaxID=1665126 RepID=A0A0H4TLQ5_9BACT|nr:50S ribosomal protein L18, large subunit ribosomal protein L18 [uncultured Nitrospirae bacterium Rifle_16ft_4_minimus_18822]